MATKKKAKAADDKVREHGTGRYGDSVLDIRSKVTIAYLRRLLKEQGSGAMAEALVRILPLHEGTWVAIRNAVPDGVFQVCRGGYHMYKDSLVAPYSFLPDAHPQIHVLNTKRYATVPPLPEWVLCSFCGKPIKVVADPKATLLTLTNCPHVTPEWRGSGWIVETIPIPEYLAPSRPE